MPQPRSRGWWQLRQNLLERKPVETAFAEAGAVMENVYLLHLPGDICEAEEVLYLAKIFQWIVADLDTKSLEAFDCEGCDRLLLNVCACLAQSAGAVLVEIAANVVEDFFREAHELVHTVALLSRHDRCGSHFRLESGVVVMLYFCCKVLLRRLNDGLSHVSCSV